MQLKLHMVTIEDLMPRDHFLRKLEARLDLSFVYEETAHLYSRRLGRPPIDPVVLVKYLLVGYLYGIPSERKIEQRIQTDIALRWYLGLDLLDPVPDHSTISQLRRRKPGFRKVLRSLFERVVRQCIESGLVSGRLVATDSTHVRANASVASEELVDAQESPAAYWERLDRYEEEAAEEFHRRTGKKHRTKRAKMPKKSGRNTKKRVSRTDPEAGHMNRPGKPVGPHYLSHQTLDTDHGIILDVVVTPGNENDFVTYLDQLERVHWNVIPIVSATADSGYDYPLAHRVLDDMRVDLVVHTRNTHRSQEGFVYDEERDVFTCPGGKVLPLTYLQRSASGIYWLYRPDANDCAACSLREQCMGGSTRTVSRNCFQPSVQKHHSRQGDPSYRAALLQRQIWCEGTFAAQKREHNLKRVTRRGLEAAEDHCLLSATALNLKRMIRCLD